MSSRLKAPCLLDWHAFVPLLRCVGLLQYTCSLLCQNKLSLLHVGTKVSVRLSMS